MGIHHSEFEEMFNCLADEIPISLCKAVNKWKEIKEGESSIREWLKVLEDKAMEEMDNGYSVGTVMMKVWQDCYGSITEDSERWYFHISDLRERFFDGSLDKLEAYEDDLRDRYISNS